MATCGSTVCYFEQAKKKTGEGGKEGGKDRKTIPLSSLRFNKETGVSSVTSAHDLVDLELDETSILTCLPPFPYTSHRLGNTCSHFQMQYSGQQHDSHPNQRRTYTYCTFSTQRQSCVLKPRTKINRERRLNSAFLEITAFPSAECGRSSSRGRARRPAAVSWAPRPGVQGCGPHLAPLGLRSGSFPALRLLPPS